MISLIFTTDLNARRATHLQYALAMQPSHVANFVAPLNISAGVVLCRDTSETMAGILDLGEILSGVHEDIAESSENGRPDNCLQQWSKIALKSGTWQNVVLRLFLSFRVEASLM